ncbi:glycosyl hydrolase family 8 [Rhizobium helianthi]|uniref:cellulase n=1 Tax=Rhizobium helianthi TaxID=1132695 RepID=A0ABW4M7Q6_9HYPH
MFRFMAILMALSFASVAHAAETDAPVTAAEWASYKGKFLDPTGRIVDNGNGGISHSEGQGYGLLLAYLANSPSDFEQIWSFTRTELLLRNDGLAVWKWDPSAKPHVKDINNATDGDLLIAYALALGGAQWRRMDYVEAAARIARAVLSETVISTGGRTVLLPGVAGFRAGDREDGPVVNPSYWLFEAMPVMKLLAPSDQWDKLRDDGVAILRSLDIGPAKLPPEWASLRQKPKASAGFEPQFSYNAIRVPLYLVRGDIRDKDLLRRIKNGMVDRNGIVSIIDLPTGKPVEQLPDRGYQIVHDLVECVLDGKPLPETVKQFQPEFYYPATLQLLSLAYARENRPSCI